MGINSKQTIAEVVEKVLNENSRPLSIKELLELVINKKLYHFKEGADSKSILTKEIKKKCINQKYTNKSKVQVFFYDYKINKYGLLSWISKAEEENYIDEFNRKQRVSRNELQATNKEKKNVNSEGIPITNNEDKYDAIIGISVISIAWVFFTIILFFEQHGAKLNLNAIGDYLAGFSAPLLFIWLVYGVFLQKEEFGKVVASFKLQKEEFSDSVKTMKDQVAQVEIQHLHTWFNRNINMIENIKRLMFKNLKIENIDSITLIKQGLEKDIQKNHIEYFRAYDELKNILDLMLYIEDYLKKFIDENKNNQILHKSACELDKEFNMLMGEDKKNVEEIMLLVYILIELSKKDQSEFTQYQIYNHWIKKNDEILDIIVKNDGKVEIIAKNISSIICDIDLKNISGD